jgi:hypothetical protein
MLKLVTLEGHGSLLFRMTGRLGRESVMFLFGFGHGNVWTARQLYTQPRYAFLSLGMAALELATGQP